MSIYSTQNITRDDAIAKIMAVMVEASNERLENILFECYGKYNFENYLIVVKQEDEEDV